MDKSKPFKKKKFWLEGPNLEQEGKKSVKDVCKKDEKKKDEDVKTKDLEEEFVVKGKKKTWKTELEQYQLRKSYKKELLTPIARLSPKPKQKSVDSTSTKDDQNVKVLKPTNKDKLTKFKSDLLKDAKILTQDVPKYHESRVDAITTSPIEQTSLPEIVSEDVDVQQPDADETVTNLSEQVNQTQDIFQNLVDNQVVDDGTNISSSEQVKLDQNVAKDLTCEKPVVGKTVVSWSEQVKLDQNVAKDLTYEKPVAGKTVVSSSEQVKLDQDVAKDLTYEKPVAGKTVVSSSEQTNLTQEVSKNMVENEAVVDKIISISNEQKLKAKGLRPVTKNDFQIEVEFKSSKKRCPKDEPSYEKVKYKDSEEEIKRLRKNLKVKPIKKTENVYDKKKKKKKF